MGELGTFPFEKEMFFMLLKKWADGLRWNDEEKLTWYNPENSSVDVNFLL